MKKRFFDSDDDILPIERPMSLVTLRQGHVRVEALPSSGHLGHWRLLVRCHHRVEKPFLHWQLITVFFAMAGRIDRFEVWW